MIVAYKGCGLGGREPSAKQKAFGTGLATAPSPASLQGGEKSPCSHGGLFRRLKKPGAEEEWKRGH